MEEIKKLNVKIGALTRSISYLLSLETRSENQESLLGSRKKELMIFKGKRTKLANKLTAQVVAA